MGVLDFLLSCCGLIDKRLTVKFDLVHCDVGAQRRHHNGLSRVLSLLQYEGESVIIWNEEPAETEIRFIRLKDEVRMEVWCFVDHRREFDRGDRVLTAAGSYQQICLPFWRALRSLQGRFSPEQLDARWHRSFPGREIEFLTRAIKEEKF
jgi:hypothetical protein